MLVNAEPPAAAAYQLTLLPDVTVFVKLTTVVPHTGVLVTVGNVAVAFTVATTSVRVAEAHVVAVITDPT